MLQFLRMFDLELVHVPGRTDLISTFHSRLHLPHMPGAPFTNLSSVISSALSEPIAKGKPFDLQFWPSTSFPNLIDSWWPDYRLDALTCCYFDDFGRPISQSYFRFGRIWRDGKLVIPLSRASQVVAAFSGSFAADRQSRRDLSALMQKHLVSQELGKPLLRPHTAAYLT